jgi:hypothetical protein
MYHELPRHASFWGFLFSIDQDLAEQARLRKCPCGGCLHRANYPRKPRGGGDDLPQEYDFRLSFCCGREGCRKRVTPRRREFLQSKAVRPRCLGGPAAEVFDRIAKNYEDGSPDSAG